MADVFAGVDLGGTNTKMALATANGTILAERSVPTGSHQGPEAVLNRIADAMTELAAGVNARPCLTTSARPLSPS